MEIIAIDNHTNPFLSLGENPRYVWADLSKRICNNYRKSHNFSCQTSKSIQ